MDHNQTFADNVDLKEMLAVERAKNNALRAEVERLTAELSAQSELVQRDWLSPIEAEGLMAKVASLTAELAAMRERERWVSVGERLPKPGQCVSLWIQPFSYVPGAEKLGAYMPMLAPDAPWRSTWDLIYYATSEVTHWRELPAPPEAK